PPGSTPFPYTTLFRSGIDTLAAPLGAGSLWCTPSSSSRRNPFAPTSSAICSAARRGYVRTGSSSNKPSAISKCRCVSTGPPPPRPEDSHPREQSPRGQASPSRPPERLLAHNTELSLPVTGTAPHNGEPCTT